MNYQAKHNKWSSSRVPGGVSTLSPLAYVVTFVLTILLFAGGCTHSTRPEQPKPLFAIDLQTRFLHDSVRVAIDDAEVFDGTVTTLHAGIVDLACRITPGLDAGYHRVTLFVSNLGLRADTAITVEDSARSHVGQDDETYIV